MLTIIGCLVFVNEASAKRPSLEVDFQCRELVYCQNFAKDLEKLQRDLAKKLIENLSQRFRCFDFVESGGEYRLTIALDRLADYRVVFLISLMQSDGVPITEEEVAWTFRPKDEYTRPIGDLKAFRAELCFAFDGNLRSKDTREKLTNKILSKIKVADHAFPIPESSKWAMPFSSEETGILDDTLFEVKTSFRVRGGSEKRAYLVLACGVTDQSVPVEYRAKILGDTQRPKGDWPEDLKASGVFILKPNLLLLATKGSSRSPCFQ